MTLFVQETAGDSKVAATIEGHTYTVADLRRVLDRVCNSADWKASWAAYVPHQIVPVVVAAVEWFHGDTPRVRGLEPAPTTGRVLLEGRGYQG